MKMMKRGTDLLMKWQYIEGRRARAVWIDSRVDGQQQAALAHQRARFNEVRRVV